MNSDSRHLFYICGGRSFYASNPGRKIFEVVQVWRQLGFDVDHICGGDVVEQREIPSAQEQSSEPVKASQSRPGNSKLKSLFPPLVHSLSEKRDIAHDQLVLNNIRRRSQTRKPDLIWERSSRLHEAGLIHANELNVPFVLEWKDHLIDYSYSWYRKKALRTEARKNQQADWVVVESNVLKSQLINEGVDEQKIIVAHNAIDPNAFQANTEDRQTQRETLGIAPDTILVGYLGSYAFYHNTALLVEAAKILENDDRIKIVMVGDGLELSQTKTLAQSLGVLDRNLLMLPRVNMRQVPPLLCALDMAVLPGSTDIICPIKIQEYMSSGTATIAPDYECNREVISNGETGILFDPNKADSLANSIEKLAGNVELRNSISLHGRNHVAQNFTWPMTWGKALEHVVQSL